MFILIFIVCLSVNVSFIDANDNLMIKIIDGRNCTVPSEVTFTEGQNVTFVIDKSAVINHGWWRRSGFSGCHSKEFSDTFTVVVEKSFGGMWEFEALQHRDTWNLNLPMAIYEDHNYTQSICRTNATIIPASAFIQISKTNVIIAFTIAALVLIILVAQTAYIIHLKVKVKSSGSHHHLSVKPIPVEVDKVRYSSDPGQKILKVTHTNESQRESCIYAAPDMEIPERAQMEPTLTALPPQPPAIHTIPRTPRIDHGIRPGHQSMVDETINAMKPKQFQHPTFPRPKQQEREINVANRPPLPLPTHNEPVLYEQMEEDENTYEPPPVIHTLPTKPPVAQQKMPLPMPKPLELARDAQNRRNRPGSKPLVTPKPQQPGTTAHVSPPVNELEDAFRRRNANGPAVSIQVGLIPGPNKSKVTKPQSRAPPAVMSKPQRSPLLTPPIQEEIYYNETHDSSDEEWTYEPLKPMNNFNIYSE